MPGDAPSAVLYAVTVVTVLPLAELALVQRYSVLPSGLISADPRIVIACPAPPTYEWSYIFLALAVRLPGADPVGSTHAVSSTPPLPKPWVMNASMPPSLDTETWPDPRDRCPPTHSTAASCRR